MILTVDKVDVIIDGLFIKWHSVQQAIKMMGTNKEKMFMTGSVYLSFGKNSYVLYTTKPRAVGLLKSVFSTSWSFLQKVRLYSIRM